MSKKILGINNGHDGGCTLIYDGKVVATMAEERLNRVKYSYGWTNSLRYCLENSNTKLSDIDLVVFSDYSDRLKKGYDGGLGLLGLQKKKCINVDHHLSHACSVYFTSPFDKTLVLVFDAKGNNQDTESVFVAEGNKVNKIGGNPLKNHEKGIVGAYQAFTSYFGWHQNSAGKTMGLSSYGDADKYKKHLIYAKSDNGMFYNKLDNHTADGVEKFCKRNNISIPDKFLTDATIYKHMATWIQSEFERVVISTVKKYQKETGVKNLCIAGGGALNTVCNSKILSETKIENIYVFPAAGDSGQSIGNALYGYFIHSSGNSKKIEWSNDYRIQTHKAKGIEPTIKRFSEITNLVVPKSANIKYKKLLNVAKQTAKLIEKGHVVGWFQGGSEIGPRALGHRSILCDARKKEMKDILNKKVKHREPFRPFAGSVMLEKMQEFFDWEKESPFMLFVVPVKKGRENDIPAVTHVDGTCRIQTVTKKENGLYYDLINEFDKLTGVPLIVNTSFNVAGEPIVETPSDAIKCFLGTDIDYLVIGDYLVEKT